MNIGEKIKALRKLNKLSQKELALKIGKTVSSIQKFENGDRYPKLETILILSAVLKVEVIELFRDTTKEELNENNIIHTYLEFCKKIAKYLDSEVINEK